jgi:hypothetical protein
MLVSLLCVLPLAVAGALFLEALVGLLLDVIDPDAAERERSAAELELLVESIGDDWPPLPMPHVAPGPSVELDLDDREAA